MLVAVNCVCARVRVTTKSAGGKRRRRQRVARALAILMLLLAVVVVAAIVVASSILNVVRESTLTRIVPKLTATCAATLRTQIAVARAGTRETRVQNALASENGQHSLSRPQPDTAAAAAATILLHVDTQAKK